MSRPGYGVVLDRIDAGDIAGFGISMGAWSMCIGCMGEEGEEGENGYVTHSVSNCKDLLLGLASAGSNAVVFCRAVWR